MKTTDSEFYGFTRDRYTTLEETHDRILATALTVRWRYVSTEQDWFSSFIAPRNTLTEVFALHHSLALQQTLYAMGEAVLEESPGIAEIRFSTPNKHHLPLALSPFGPEDPTEGFYQSHRPSAVPDAP